MPCWYIPCATSWHPESNCQIKQGLRSLHGRTASNRRRERIDHRLDQIPLELERGLIQHQPRIGPAAQPPQYRASEAAI